MPGLSFVTPLAYDWRYALDAIRSYYGIADEIILGLDRNLVSWSGNKFRVDLAALGRGLRKIDVDRKVRLLRGGLHAESQALDLSHHILAEAARVRQRRFRIVHAFVHGPAQVLEERAEDAPVHVAFVAGLVDDGSGRPARLGVSQRLEPRAGGECGAGTSQRAKEVTSIRIHPKVDLGYATVYQRSIGLELRVDSEHLPFVRHAVDVAGTALQGERRVYCTRKSLSLKDARSED